MYCDDDKGFKKPETPHTKIWRYMDLSKYLAMLVEKCLHFTCVKKLGDPFECSFFPFAEDIFNRISEFGKNHTKVLWEKVYKHRSSTFVNCWHVNEGESAALWKICLKSNEGIAIQSTFEKLTESVKDCDKKVYVGTVNYGHLKSCKQKNGFRKISASDVIMTKRESFVHEAELRAVILTDPTNPSDDKGINIKVKDLNALIEQVLLSPESEEWILETIKKVTTDYGLNCSVEKSKLYKKPDGFF